MIKGLIILISFAILSFIALIINKNKKKTSHKTSPPKEITNSPTHKATVNKRRFKKVPLVGFKMIQKKK